MCAEQSQMCETPDVGFIYAWQVCNGEVCYNPITGLPIKRGSRTYRTMVKYYYQELGKNEFCTRVHATDNCKYFVPDDNMISQYYDVFGFGGVYRSRNLDDPIPDLEYICEWRSNPSVRPRTHEPVIMYSPLWKHCESRCQHEETKRNNLTTRESLDH